MGLMKSISARIDATGKRFGIVVSRWNEVVTKELLAGAIDTLKSHGDPEVIVLQVPGTWEIPLAAKLLIEDHQVQAVVALGCILQGATTHATLLASDTGTALMSLQMAANIPISWGILTPETMEQAMERAGMKKGNKGREAALAAIEMAALQDASKG